MTKLSKKILNHINNNGNGFEMDDILSNGTGIDFDFARKNIIIIHNKYKNSNFLVGTSNPESYSELRRLAKILARCGY